MSEHVSGFDALRVTGLLDGDRPTALGVVVTPAGAAEPVRRCGTDEDEDEDDEDDFDDDDVEDDEDASEDDDGDAHDEGGED